MTFLTVRFIYALFAVKAAFGQYLYKVETKTADVAFAGMDDDIYLVIKSNGRECQTQWLDSPADDFEAGDVNAFEGANLAGNKI